MKLMKLRFWEYLRLTAMMLAGGLLSTPAEEPARTRGTPIIFSEPKSDTVSSNLNQLEVKTSLFQGLESDLKKPFDIFNAGWPAASFSSPFNPIAPPAAPINNRRIKELIDKRAEMMLSGPDAGDPDLLDDDPFKKAGDKLDAAGRKLKTPLDRYYDRLDRERAALTNQVRNPDRFGDKTEADGKKLFGQPTESSFDSYLKAPLRSPDGLSEPATVRSGLFSDNTKPKTFEDLMGSRPSDPAPSSSVIKETRLEQFKRLLDRPAYTPSASGYSPSLPVVGSVQQPLTASLVPTWSSSSLSASAAKPVNPTDSFTTRAGLVGAPPSLPGLHGFSDTPSSLNTPPPSPIRPPPTFAIPKRQF